MDRFVCALQEPVVTLDRERRVVHASREAIELLGGNASALYGKPCYEAIPAIDSQTGRPCCEGCPVFESNQYQWAHSRRLVAPNAEDSGKQIECLLLRCAVPTLNSTLIFLGDRKVEDPWTTPSEIEVTQNVLPALLGANDVDHAARAVLAAAVEGVGAIGGSIRIFDSGTSQSNVLEYRYSKGLAEPESVELQDDQDGLHGDAERLRVPVMRVCADHYSEDSRGRCLALCVPFLASDRLLGTLQVEGPAGEFEVARCIRTLFPLASQMSAFLRWASTSVGDAARDRLRITALGKFCVEVNGTEIPQNAFSRRHGLELLRRLAGTRNGSLTREEIEEEFWPDASPRAAGQHLRVVLHSMKRALQPDLVSGQPSSFLEIDREHIGFTKGSVEIDVDEFLERHQRCLSLGELGYTREAIRVGCQAIDLYGGSFMEDEEYSDWCIGQRARLNEVYLDLVSRVGALFEEAGELESAIQMYQRALLIEPALESTHRSLMNAFIAAGRQDDAIRQFEFCADALSSALGIDPAVETLRLREAAVGVK